MASLSPSVQAHRVMDCELGDNFNPIYGLEAVPLVSLADAVAWAQQHAEHDESQVRLPPPRHHLYCPHPPPCHLQARPLPPQCSPQPPSPKPSSACLLLSLLSLQALWVTASLS
jgi:hypothetical protein